MKRIITVLAVLVLAAMLATSASAADYKANAKADAIELDGVIESGEWGEPVFVTTPDDCFKKQNLGWNYWSFTPAPQGQTVELYVTNSGDGVYVACRMIGAGKDIDNTDTGMVWAHPHFTFTLARYDAVNICPRIVFQEEDYEQYSCYILGFIGGEKWSFCTSQGMDTHELADDEFACAYDEATRTYTYECLIPYSYTNLDIYSDNTIVMGLDITDVFRGEGGNRYLVSTAGEQAMGWEGPGNFCHTNTNPLIIDILPVSELGGKRFMPTEAEKAAVAARDAKKNGTTQPADGQPEQAAEDGVWTIAIIVACVAMVVVVAAVTAVIITVKKRRK